MAKDVPFTQKHQRAIMLILVLLVVPTFGVAGPEIYGFIQTLKNPLKDAVGTFEVAPGEMLGVTNKEFREKSEQIYSFFDSRPSPEQTWEHIIQVAQAKHMGLSVSDQELADGLRQMGADVNPEFYRQYVQRRRFTIPQYEKFMREILLRRKLDEFDNALPLITSDFVYERFKNEALRYKVDYLAYAAAEREAEVDSAAWTDEDLASMWEDKANVVVKEKLRIPAQLSIDVLYAPFSTYPLEELGDLADGIEVTEAEMMNLYASPEQNDRYRKAKDEKLEEEDEEGAGAGETGAEEKGESGDGDEKKDEEKPPLEPFEDVKARIEREIRIRKVVEKALAEATVSKKALDAEEAAAVKKAEEEAKKKAEEEALEKPKDGGDAPGEGESGSAPKEGGGDAPRDDEAPKDGSSASETPKEGGLPPEPREDESPVPGEDEKSADEGAVEGDKKEPEATENPEFRVDLGAIAEKYKLSIAKLERLDDKALETAQLADGLAVRINAFGLKDRDLTRLFMGPGGAAGFGAVTAFEASRLPELDAVKDEFRTGMRDKKSMDLADEAARAFQKLVREETEKQHEARKPQSVREREARQKEAEEAATKARAERELEEKRAAEEAEKKKAEEGSKDGSEEPPKDGAAAPASDGDKPSDEAPPKKEEDGSPPPAPPQGEPDAPVPAKGEGEGEATPADEPPKAPEKELNEQEWNELIITGLGETFERLAAEKGLDVRRTGFLTFIQDRQSPEYVNEKDAAVKYLRGIGSVKNLRVGQVNVYRDNDAKAMYVVRMKEKEDPAWEEMSQEKATEIRQSLLQTALRNRMQFSRGAVGFDALAREVKLATEYRSPPPEATTGVPRPLPGGIPERPR